MTTFRDCLQAYRAALRDAILNGDDALKAQMQGHAQELANFERTLQAAHSKADVMSALGKLWDNWNTGTHYEGFEFIANHAFHNMYEAARR
jgi:hypothetical protein